MPQPNAWEAEPQKQAISRNERHIFRRHAGEIPKVGITLSPKGFSRQALEIQRVMPRWHCHPWDLPVLYSESDVTALSPMRFSRKLWKLREWCHPWIFPWFEKAQQAGGRREGYLLGISAGIDASHLCRGWSVKTYVDLVWCKTSYVDLVWCKTSSSSNTHQNETKPLSDFLFGNESAWWQRDEVSSVEFLIRPANNNKKPTNLRSSYENTPSWTCRPVHRYFVAGRAGLTIGILRQHSCHSLANAKLDESFALHSFTDIDKKPQINMIIIK